MVKEMGSEMKPAWLQGLMAETFFVGCGTHESARKNEKNIFCLYCCQSICPHCVPSHRSHPLLQVRRYVYHDVARLADLEKLIDCSYVQPYTINNAKVVFLNQRPQSRPFKGSANNCLNCDRMLQDPFHFCSLSCKVDHIVLQREDLSSILYRFDESDLAFSQFDSLQMDGADGEEEQQRVDPNSILEGPLHLRDPSASTNSSCTTSSLGAPESSEVVKKKKGNGLLPKFMLSLSRRKGAPHRSPLS